MPAQSGFSSVVIENLIYYPPTQFFFNLKSRRPSSAVCACLLPPTLGETPEAIAKFYGLGPEQGNDCGDHGSCRGSVLLTSLQLL